PQTSPSASAGSTTTPPPSATASTRCGMGPITATRGGLGTAASYGAASGHEIRAGRLLPLLPRGEHQEPDQAQPAEREAAPPQQPAGAGDQHFEHQLGRPRLETTQVHVGVGQELDAAGDVGGAESPALGQQLAGPERVDAEQLGGVGLAGGTGAVDAKHVGEV